MSMRIRVEFIAGTAIESAAQDALNLCTRLGGVTVMFKFNGVECMACDGDKPEALVDAFHTALSSTAPYKFARGRA